MPKCEHPMIQASSPGKVCKICCVPFYTDRPNDPTKAAPTPKPGKRLSHIRRQPIAIRPGRVMQFGQQEAAEVLARVRAEKCKRNFAEFVRQGWGIVNRGQRLYWNWHMEQVCLHVQAMYEELAKARVDHTYVMQVQNLLINIPPRSAKSMIVCVFAPAWAWIHWPELKIRCLSVNPKVSARDSRYCRELITSPWYQQAFIHPLARTGKDWMLKGDVDAVELFANTAGGERHAGSMNARIVGEGTDVINVDDPHDPDDVWSSATRQSPIDKYENSIHNRANDPLRVIRIGICQRTHEADWSRYVLDTDDWEHFMVRQQYESKNDCGCKTCDRGQTWLGWSDPREGEGKLMHPERFTQAWVDKESRRLASMGWASQHQQRPAPAEGNWFKKRDWRWWKPDGTHNPRPRPHGCSDEPAVPLPRMDWMVISIDAAFKKLEEGSRVSMLVVGGKGPDRFVLDNRTRPMSFTETVREIKVLHKQYPKALRILIEAKANGSAIVDALRTSMPGLIEIEPEGGKESRASAIQPIIEGGNLYLPDGPSWVEEFVAEMGVFPNGRHDDQVDALSQALIYMSQSPGAARAAMLARL